MVRRHRASGDAPSGADGQRPVGGITCLDYYLEQVRAQDREDVAAQFELSFRHYPAKDPERAEARFGPHFDYFWNWYGMPEDPTQPRFVEPAVLAEEIRQAQARGATGGRWFAPFTNAAAGDSIEVFTSLIEDVKPLVEADQGLGTLAFALSRAQRR